MGGTGGGLGSGGGGAGDRSGNPSGSSRVGLGGSSATVDRACHPGNAHTMKTDKKISIKNDNGKVEVFIHEINKELSKESDWGCTLMSCSCLDAILYKILQGFFVEGDTSKKLIEGFNAPLGSFSTRISAAFALGLISDQEYREITILRRVRNRFAHHVQASFDMQDIRDLCYNLTLNVPDVDPRGRYVTSALVLIHRLSKRVAHVATIRRRSETWP